MSGHKQGPPGRPDPSGPLDSWGADELDTLLAEPGGAGRLGQIMVAAGAPGEAQPQVGEEAALIAFRAAFPAEPARRLRLLPGMSGRASAAVLAAGLVLSGSAAAAAAGALPDAAQQTAKAVLAKVGVSVPGPHDHAVVRPDRRDTSTHATVASAEPSSVPSDGERPGSGNEVSALAQSTDSTGVSKGPAVSGRASDGKSQAGQHGKAARTTGKRGTATPTARATKRRNGRTHPSKPAATPHTPSAHPRHTSRPRATHTRRPQTR